MMKRPTIKQVWRALDHFYGLMQTGAGFLFFAQARWELAIWTLAGAYFYWMLIKCRNTKLS